MAQPLAIPLPLAGLSSRTCLETSYGVPATGRPLELASLWAVLHTSPDFPGCQAALLEPLVLFRVATGQEPFVLPVKHRTSPAMRFLRLQGQGQSVHQEPWLYHCRA